MENIFFGIFMLWMLLNLGYLFFLLDAVVEERSLFWYLDKKNGISIGFILTSILCIPAMIFGAVVFLIFIALSLITIPIIELLRFKIGGNKK